MELDGKRIALLAEDLYQVLELWYPLLRLREAREGQSAQKQAGQ